MPTKKPYTLQVFNPITHTDKSLIEDFTQNAHRVRTSKKRIGGLWDLTFDIPLTTKKVRNTTAYLQDWFYNRLFCTIEQTLGGALTWRGFIRKMDLTLNGATQTTSYEDIYNAVRVAHLDEDGENQITAWATDPTSIAQYGRKEETLYLRNATAAAANSARDTKLTESKIPWPRYTSLDQDAPDTLSVRCAGFIFTANNKYVGTTTLDGNTGNLSAAISAIITNDCEFLTAGTIETNAIQYKRNLDQPIRAWDYLLELNQIGDGTQIFDIATGINDMTHYKPTDTEPKFYWAGRKKGLVTKSGNLSIQDAWAAQPGVCRDLTQQGHISMPGSLLESNRDAWIYEIEMADELTQPILKPAQNDEQELRSALQMYRRWLADNPSGVIDEEYWSQKT